MARIGFKKAYYAVIEGNKYGEMEEFEKVVDEKFAPEYNSAELYANDGLAESDYSFKKGTLSLTIADDDDKLLAALFGNTYGDSGDTDVAQYITDIAPEVGYGHIIPKMVGGERKFKVEFFPRVKFTKVTSDNKTRGESVEFSTTALEATVMPLDKFVGPHGDGLWEAHNTFTQFEAAEEFLKQLFGVSA